MSIMMRISDMYMRRSFSCMEEVKDAESREEKTGMPFAEEYSFLCGRSGKRAWNYDDRGRI